MTRSDESTLVVRTEHLTDEMLLVDIGHTGIVSDHPEYLGGSGKGPTPGEFVKGALASSAALEIGKVVEQEALPVQSLVVACSSESETVNRDDGPMPTSTTLANFRLHVALVGSLGEPDVKRIESLARNSPVAKAMAQGLTIEEHDVFRQEPAVRPARGNTLLIDRMFEGRPGPDEKRVTPANAMSLVTAQYLGQGRVLVKWAGTAHLIGQEPDSAHYNRGSFPEHFLLAGLSACTSVFVARAAAVVGADAEIRVCSTADFGTPALGVRIDKTLEVIGELNENQKGTIAHYGDNCAIGETLRRKSKIGIAVDLFREPSETHVGASLSSMSSVAKEVDTHLEAVACDDGSCCIPE